MMLERTLPLLSEKSTQWFKINQRNQDAERLSWQKITRRLHIHKWCTKLCQFHLESHQQTPIKARIKGWGRGSRGAHPGVVGEETKTSMMASERGEGGLREEGFGVAASGGAPPPSSKSSAARAASERGEGGERGEGERARRGRQAEARQERRGARVCGREGAQGRRKWGERKGAGRPNHFLPKSHGFVAHLAGVGYGYANRGAPYRGAPCISLSSSKEIKVQCWQQRAHSPVIRLLAVWHREVPGLNPGPPTFFVFTKTIFQKVRTLDLPLFFVLTIFQKV
jgi:hypothetical protein